MSQLIFSIGRLAQLQGQSLNGFELSQVAQHIESNAQNPQVQIAELLAQLHLPAARWLGVILPEHTPCLAWQEDLGWFVLCALNAQAEWVIECVDLESNQVKQQLLESVDGLLAAKLHLEKPYLIGASPAFAKIKDIFFSHKKSLIEAVIGGAVINLIALTTSLFSMQVYDRVVPTGAEQTLLVLTLGVIVANVFEMLIKLMRSHLFEGIVVNVDQQLARSVFLKFLNIRLDQMPRSVGGMASQLRGYETVRGFLSSLTNHLLVDAPFAILFSLIIFFMAGWIAVIPLIFFVISLAVGIHSKKKVEKLTAKITAAANFKTGLLVEVIEGVETIKSGASGWRMLSRWMSTVDEARISELQMRHLTEHSQYLMALLQQLSYVLLVASGALLVSKGNLSMGALIACSILSGRILTPVTQIPGILVQWGHTKSSLQGLDKLWLLKDDHDNAIPVQCSQLQGAYKLENIEVMYNSKKALSIAQLHISAGQKIGVLGPVGAGKTTFLRLLSGMYAPNSGRILLDGIDLSLIAKPALAEKLGYLQQEGRLFAGTLRENLILGMLDPGDDAILNVAKQTGLHESVILSHPKGLQQEIFEGGLGLSGGQRQLVNLTRIFLRQPSIWLLDEPTASMDRALEARILNLFSKTLSPCDSFVVVTHKTELLQLVDRVMVIANHQIVMDGPRDEVLKKLSAPAINIVNQSAVSRHVS